MPGNKLKPQVGEIWEVSNGKDSALVEVLGRYIWGITPSAYVRVIDATNCQTVAMDIPCEMTYFIRRIQEAEHER